MNNNINTKKEEKTSSDYKQFSEFGGIIDLDINIRLPNSFYEAVKEYSNIANMSPREMINSEVIDGIEALELGHLNDLFIKKYNLHGLTRDKKRGNYPTPKILHLKG